eukprot:11544175-Alexandrium_andersonii.AAC.1
MLAGEMPASTSAARSWRLAAIAAMVSSGMPLRLRLSRTSSVVLEERTSGRRTAWNAPAMSTKRTAQLCLLEAA